MQLLENMLSQNYAKELREKIFDYQTFVDPTHYGALYAGPQDSGTAHVSIIGPNGDAVSLTTTINSAYVVYMLFVKNFVLCYFTASIMEN